MSIQYKAPSQSATNVSNIILYLFFIWNQDIILIVFQYCNSLLFMNSLDFVIHSFCNNSVFEIAQSSTLNLKWFKLQFSLNLIALSGSDSKTYKLLAVLPSRPPLPAEFSVGRFAISSCSTHEPKYSSWVRNDNFQ